MKYARLTKEQFEALHQEFITFLATQSIDKMEWDEIKSQRPEVAAQELDVFSDLVWEGVLTRARYFEQYGPTHVFLFKADEALMSSIVLKVLPSGVNLMEQGGVTWLSENLFTDAVEIRIGQKPFGTERNVDLFALVQQGAVLSDGQFYEQIDAIVKS